VGGGHALTQLGGPDGDAAFVEDDGRVVYLYLRAAEGSRIPLKSVWVQNRVAAPDQLDVAGMKQGQPPLMPRANCRHARGTDALDPTNLRLVWLPEGYGVGLFDRQNLLAAVMPWSGRNGFDGFARSAVGQGPLAWELPPSGAIERRFGEAEAHWKAWDQKPDPWQRIQEAELAAYEAVFGKETGYFAIDGGAWPPRGLIRVDRPGGIVLATVGLGLRPQPGVEGVSDAAEAFRRIELGMLLPPSTEERVVRAWGAYIAGQAKLPWARCSWLGPGHTVPCDVSADRGFPAVLLGSGESLGRVVNLPQFDGDPVKLVWLVPITVAEWEQAKTIGSAALLAALRGVHGKRAV